MTATKPRLELDNKELKRYLLLLRQVPARKIIVPLISADLVYRQWLLGEAIHNWISWVPRLKSQPGWSWAELRLLKQSIFCRAFSKVELEVAIATSDPLTRVYEKCLAIELNRRSRPDTTTLHDRDWAMHNYENNPRAVLRWMYEINSLRLPLYGLDQEEFAFLWKLAKSNSEKLSKACPRLLYTWMQRPSIQQEIKCETLEERATSMVMFAMDCNFKSYSVCVAPLLDLSKQGQVQELNKRKWTNKQVHKAEKRFTKLYKDERQLHVVIVDQLIARLKRNPLDNGALGALKSRHLMEERREVIAALMENSFSQNRAYQLLCHWKSEGWIAECPRVEVLNQLRTYSHIELKGLVEDLPQEVALVVSFHYEGKFRFFMQWLAPLICKWTRGCDVDGLVKYLGAYAVLWASCPTENVAELLDRVPGYEPWATLFSRLI